MPGEIDQNSTILVTGAGGLLGRRVTQVAVRHGIQIWEHHHNRPESAPSNEIYIGDLGDVQHVEQLSREINPTIIINCAALANVDLCEKNVELSHKSNVDAIRWLTRYFPSARMAQISTDYVFPGNRKCPKPDDPTEPINIYGQHKLDGERIVLTASDKNLVIRAVLMFDKVAKRNFFSYIYNALQEGKRIEGITDQYTNPISALTAAETIIDIIVGKATGLWHIGGADYVNRFEFARRIADFFNLDAKLIEPIVSDKVVRPAARPRLAGLDVSETETFLARPAPDLAQELIRIAGLDS